MLGVAVLVVALLVIIEYRMGQQKDYKPSYEGITQRNYLRDDRSLKLVKGGKMLPISGWEKG